MRAMILALALGACDGGGGGLTAADCDSGQIFTTECARCGPTDACERTEDVCANPCEAEGELCETSGLCLDGVCTHGLCG